MIKNIKKYSKKVYYNISYYWKKVLLIIILLFLFINWYRLVFTREKMNHLPTGEYLDSLDSPNKEYTLKSYRCNPGGATMDWFVRVEVVNNKTNETFNIYYVYHDYDADMKWLDNEMVKINGRKLNIHKDYVHE